MKQCKLFIAILLAMLCLLACAAADEPTVYTSGDYQYILLEDGTAEITRYFGKAATLTVPDELDGYCVTGIGDDAFTGRHGLTSIALPDSVTRIGASSFRYCSKLTGIHVSPRHPVLATIDGVLFDKTEKKLIRCPEGFTASDYAVPNGILSIGNAAFGNCCALRNVMLPDSVTSIGDEAFDGCESLTSITIPDSVTSIGDYAFSTCKSLMSITIPDSVMHIGVNPFMSCWNLTTIRVSPSHPMFATIDGVLFDKTEKKLICYPGAYTASSYTVPGDILSIGDRAFSYCDSLTSITLPDGLTTIGDAAFYRCAALTSITFPDGLTTIGDQTFSFCDSLTSIMLPDSLTSIGDNAFGACKSLKSVTLPDNVTSIGDSAFYGCAKHLTFTVPKDSWAEQWCIDNNMNYTFPDANDWLLN